jgi:hypothetical protein
VINELYRDAAVDSASSGFSFDDEVMRQALKNIYSKSFHPMTDIEENLFNETWKAMNEATDKGFGIRQPVDPDYDFYQELKHNNAVFSAFKVHRAQNDMAAQLLDSEGKLKPFEQWSKEVQPIATHQMEHWLKTEYDTAVIRAHQAADWRQFEREKDILPNLKWLPSTSIHPGADHKIFWGTVLPVDHPFWKSHRPGDRWNCKCPLTSTDEPCTPMDGIPEGGDDDKPADGLKGNPGQTGELFDKSHPYVEHAYDGAEEAVNKFLETSIGTNVPAGLNVHEQRKWIENVHRTEEKLKLEQGKLMTFEEANGMKGNPHYKEDVGYRENCQSCVVANELRRRGYNVEAQIRIKSDSRNIPQQLSSKTEWAWIDPKTGERPKKLTAGDQYWDRNLHKEKAKSAAEMKKEFDELTKEAGRYHLSFNWKGRSIEGHIITAERFGNGGLRLYDPQIGKIVEWKDLKKNIRTEYGIRLYRVDNMLINEDIIGGIVREASE